MCGRYAYLLPPEAMAELFKTLNELVDYPPRYNIAPTQPIVTILERQGRRTAELFRWGFVPGWVKDPQQWPLLINARSETMADKPAFRDALRNTCCIVPATGYFEWKVGPDGERRPYFITSADGETLAFAGLYATWSGPNGEEVDTVCIVTTEPNAEISGVYDRMPAILRGAAIDDWLNTRDVDVREALSLAQPAPDGTMTFHPVGRAIGNANSEGPELIVPFEGEWESVRPKKKKAAGGGAQLDLF